MTFPVWGSLDGRGGTRRRDGGKFFGQMASRSSAFKAPGDGEHGTSEFSWRLEPAILSGATGGKILTHVKQTPGSSQGERVWESQGTGRVGRAEQKAEADKLRYRAEPPAAGEQRRFREGCGATRSKTGGKSADRRPRRRRKRNVSTLGTKGATRSAAVRAGS
ncbi:uncharacterized protein B0I36DRAFT_312018 [Microdochium trichocladiopsis]|uniref:Uncharacterized protein n=1 Tax=Microdochium trichocladiopsis TaxID=1682393 RepID=A0A9P8YL85_9PEZI|nr:uncharacterized protein B0I36DRAFT_312018 [Microdochium trichocladiopsis]KAH7041049.1 hypothetical protein B0I36DRAFT_312018 [Microdochium trichocladiopsis]